MDEGWSVVYKSAIQRDGSLLFPERLSHSFLDRQRRVQGSYIFANQYQNEVIPEDAKSFKPQWLKYWESLPQTVNNFAFIDPAIGQKKHHDFTGIAVISASYGAMWHVRVAARYRLTPTEIVQKMFDIQKEFNCKAIGVEDVAYQEALLYMASEEMRRRNMVLPIKGIKRSAQSKQSRILGLVPRFEWGRVFLPRGCKDFEDEYSMFPRGKFDDILDAMASLEELVYYPEADKPKQMSQPSGPNHPDYEKWYIQSLAKRNNQSDPNGY